MAQHTTSCSRHHLPSLTWPPQNPEAFAVQKTMVEAWQIVTEAYVDDPFSHNAWDESLVAGLTEAAAAGSGQEAQGAIPALLSKLGDPYTRWLPPEQYRDFRIGNDGELSGVGMMIATDPQSGRCGRRRGTARGRFQRVCGVLELMPQLRKLISTSTGRGGRHIKSHACAVPPPPWILLYAG